MFQFGQLVDLFLKLCLLIPELPFEELIISHKADLLLPKFSLLLAGDGVSGLIHRFLLQVLQVVFVLRQLVLQMFEVHLHLLLETDVAADGGLEFLCLGLEGLVVEGGYEVGVH